MIKAPNSVTYFVSNTPQKNFRFINIFQPFGKKAQTEIPADTCTHFGFSRYRVRNRHLRLWQESEPHPQSQKPRWEIFYEKWIPWKFPNYLSTDRQKRFSGGVHQNYLALVPGHVVVDPENQVPLGVEDRETGAVEEQRLLPDGQHLRLVAAGIPPLDLRSGIRVHLRHPVQWFAVGRKTAFFGMLVRPEVCLGSQVFRVVGEAERARADIYTEG